MILGLLLFLIANIAILIGAGAILRCVRTGRPSLDTVLFLLIRLALISAVVMLAGLMSAMTPLGLGAIACVGLIGLVAFRSRADIPISRLPDLGRPIMVFTILIAIRLLLQVWLFSPHLGDALAYHLPKVGNWVRAGSFTREMGLHPHVTFPAGFELVETWWVVFIRHDVLIEMAGVEFLILAVAAVYSLTRFAGLSERGSYFAAILYVMVPGLHLSATSCMNDAPVAALVVATMALVSWRAPIPLTILAAGLGIGTKPTYAHALPGVVLLAFLLRKESPIRSPSAWMGPVLAALGLIIGSFWYARNMAWYGNPIYPVGSTGYDQESVAVQAGPCLRSLWANASDLVERRIYDDQGIYGANVDFISGWGPVAFACGLVALMLAMMEDSRMRRIGAGFLVSLGSCFLFTIHNPWSLKYVFFFPAVLCIATAWLVPIVRGTSCLAALALVFSFLGTFLPYDLQWEHLRILAAQTWHERTTLAFREPTFKEGQVACFGGYMANAYLLYGPDFSRKVVYLRPYSANQLLMEMRSAGLEVLYAAPVSERQHAVLNECIRRGALQYLGGHLYRLL